VDLSPIFQALADPTRRAIVERLARGPSRVTDIALPFDMSLSAVSKHLKVLERARLVRRSRVGREHRLSLEAWPLREAARYALRYRSFWEGRLDRLESHFASRREGPP